MHKSLSVLIALSVLSAANARAQTDSALTQRSLAEKLRPGATVRVFVRSEPYVGIVRRIAGDSLYLDGRAVPIGSVDRIEVRQRATREGLKWGAIGGTLGGALVGAFIGYVVFAGCDSGDCPESATKPVVVGTIGGAGAGFLGGGIFGAVIGSALPSWRDSRAVSASAKPTPRRIGEVSLTPVVAHAGTGGTGAGARAAFMFRTPHLGLGPEVAWQSLGSDAHEVYVPCPPGSVCVDTLTLRQQVFQAGGLARLGAGDDHRLEPFATVGAGFYSWTRASGYGTTRLAGYSLGAGLQLRNTSGTRSLIAEGRWHSNLGSSGQPSPDYGFYTLSLGGAFAW